MKAQILMGYWKITGGICTYVVNYKSVINYNLGIACAIPTLLSLSSGTVFEYDAEINQLTRMDGLELAYFIKFSVNALYMHVHCNPIHVTLVYSPQSSCLWLAALYGSIY